MGEDNLSSSIPVVNKQPPEQPVRSIQKPNYWKLSFIVVLLMLVLSMGLLAYFIKNNIELSNQSAKSIIPNKISITPSPSIIPSTTSQQSGVQKISAQIEPYRLDDEGGQMIATFQINNLNKEINISQVTYWTDKYGACKAETQAFSEFIKIPADEINDYAFFQFTDENGGISEIYASSQNPIFQCGKLTE